MEKTIIVKSIVRVLASAALASLPVSSYANPTGGQVMAGTVTIQQESPAKLGITQTSNKAIVNWRIFSIAASEHTQFYQPASSSVILNRVVGADPSAILGRLTANGQVFLVNPNGIFFGKNAVVDVAALVASTHNIRNEDFLAGRYSFNIPGKPGAAVINEGTIRIADTGIAAFVAPSVANRGVIVAKLGKVALAAANGFTLDFYGDQLLTFLVSDEVAKTAFDLEGKQLTSFVESAGRIEAQGGYVLLTAKAAENAIHSVINQSGTIEATSVAQQNGEIVLAGGQHGLVANSGILDASGRRAGETGGKIQITGEQIGLLSGTRVDVSGDQGGGKAIIGGDYLGGKADDATLAQLGITREDKPVQTAAFTTMAQDAVINADAITQGNGGKVVLWSDDTTGVHGSISARGGTQGGDGGFIETSGKQYLDIAGARVNASAFSGKAGTWLLDPVNLTIDAVAASSIEGSLNSGTNFTAIADNKIDITSNITKSSGGDATFSVYGVWIYQHEGTNVTSGSGKLNIDYEATDRVWIGRGFIGGESNFATNGGNITFHGPNFVGVNGTIDAGAGNILIKAELGGQNVIGNPDKGIWIFGNTTLSGNSVTKISTLLRVDPGTSERLRVAESQTIGRLQQVAHSLDILRKIAEPVAATGAIDLRTIPGHDAEKAIVNAARLITGSSKAGAESLAKVLGTAGNIIKVVNVVLGVVNISMANNAGAYAETVNVLTRDVIMLAGGALGTSVGGAAGSLASPIGTVVGGVVVGAGLSFLAGRGYDEFLAKTIVEVSADIYRNRITSGSVASNVLGY